MPIRTLVDWKMVVTVLNFFLPMQKVDTNETAGTIKPSHNLIVTLIVSYRAKRVSLLFAKGGCEFWRRVRDSNPHALSDAGFQDRCNSHSANSPHCQSAICQKRGNASTALRRFQKAAAGWSDKPANVPKTCYRARQVQQSSPKTGENHLCYLKAKKAWF